jgi:hypothetical protein
MQAFLIIMMLWDKTAISDIRGINTVVAIKAIKAINDIKEINAIMAIKTIKAKFVIAIIKIMVFFIINTIRLFYHKKG